MEDRGRRRRWFVAGLVLGAAVPLPATVLALLVPAAERVAPLLVPGAVLLRPLSSAMAEWSGAVNVLLVCVVNGLLYGAAAALLAMVPRRRRKDGHRSSLRTLVLAALALTAAAAIAVSVVAARYAEHAAIDLRAVAVEAGFDDVGEVRVRYPFLTERLGLAVRDEEPYATLDLELDGCWLYAVPAGVVPDSRSWLPRRVATTDVRFRLEHWATGAVRRVEFRTADELLDRLAAEDPDARQPRYLCRLQAPVAP